MTALEYPVVLPSSKPRESGKDDNINNDYGYYDNGQKGGSEGVIAVLYTRGAHFLINPPYFQPSVWQ